MMPQPQALIAEVTHRCPLHCVYCSNPLQMRSRELSTESWKRVFAEAAALGCWHLHLTGGEPLLRRDTEDLVRAGRGSGLYVNLITSGLGLTPDRLDALVGAGLDHIQLSFQDCEETSANLFSGTPAHAQKLKVAGWIRRHRLAFTVNAVVHRGNLDRLDGIIAMAEDLRADKLEIAHVQYYGWAFKNRSRLLPTREQLDRSIAVFSAARERLKGVMRIDFVLPDYHARFPKPCMGGWGQGLLLIDPSGRALPCHSAGVIPGMEFASVEDRPLRWIWESSPAFARFRGDSWMQEPCRSCDRKEQDFGGCRCQAMLLTGDPNATDPICTLSPRRGLVDLALAEAASGEAGPAAGWVYRVNPAAEPQGAPQ